MSEHVSLLGLIQTRSIFTLGQPKWIKSKRSGFGQIPGYFPMIVLEKGGKRTDNMSKHVSLLGLKINKVNFHLGLAKLG
jgi:hypothetical protein